MKSPNEKEENIIKEEKEEENIEFSKDKIKSSLLNENEDFIPHKNNFEPFINDPYLDSNFISRLFMYWGYKVLKISKRGWVRKDKA